MRFKAKPYLAESNRRRAVAPVHGVAAALDTIVTLALENLLIFLTFRILANPLRQQQQTRETRTVCIAVAYRIN